MPDRRSILELSSPGSRLNLQNQEPADKFDRLIYMIISSFYEANTALWLFEDSIEHFYTPSYTYNLLAQREADQSRREIILAEIESPEHVFHDSYIKASLILKRERWTEGRLPEEIRFSFRSIPAHAFLFAVDNIASAMGILEKRATISDRAKDAVKRFNDELPQIREIRNSAHHMEDRVRGIGKGKPIPLLSRDGDLVSNSGANLILSSFDNSTLIYTTADGHSGRIDITLDTLKTVQNIVQEFLDALSWTGSVEHHPS